MMHMPDFSHALECALEAVSVVSGVELVPLHGSVGRILAFDIHADRDFPPFNRSQMDGFAVVANEVQHGESMQIIGEVAAGTTWCGNRTPHSCVAIATGAPVPYQFDAVVPHERTVCSDEHITFQCGDIPTGSCIHVQGADAKEGDILLQKHVLIQPQHIGIAASVGLIEIQVLKKPRVIVFSSGDEVVEIEATPLDHQIRNGNSPMIYAALASMDCEVVAFHHLPDDPDVTHACIAEALDGRCDLIVTIGGISAGKRDYFPDALLKENIKLVLQGANIQPGMPIIVGKHPHAVVLGLPGNPVSALVCCCLFGWPIIRGLQGVSTDLAWQSAPLSQKITPSPNRTVFRPCVLQDGMVHIPEWQGSGDLVHTTSTNGLVQLLPSNDVIEAGTIVSCIAYPWS